MLTRSLCCFKGVSPEAERRLWRAGCLSWRHMKGGAGRHLSARKAARVLDELPLLEAALEARLADFFINRLPAGHKLRILPEFQQQVAFLDIETTGLERGTDITVIGVCRNGQVTTFVRGRSLPDFLRIWPSLGIIITFNGARFDLPRILHHYGLTRSPPHIDLMTEAQAYGFVGGLKRIEQRLGYVRTPEATGDGEEAVRLWERYNGAQDLEALERLLAYNGGDLLSLVHIAKRLWALSVQGYDAPHAVY